VDLIRRNSDAFEEQSYGDRRWRSWMEGALQELYVLQQQ
jgi:hypothetical protein